MVNISKWCMIIQHTPLCTPCIASMLVSHTYIFTIDHTDQGHKEPPEPAQVEDANTEQDQGKPQFIYPPSLSFCYSFYLNYDFWMCIRL
jgi:hypothetical protein